MAVTYRFERIGRPELNRLLDVKSTGNISHMPGVHSYVRPAVTLPAKPTTSSSQVRCDIRPSNRHRANRYTCNTAICNYAYGKRTAAVR